MGEQKEWARRSNAAEVGGVVPAAIWRRRAGQKEKARWEGNGAVSPTELAHARFHPPGGTQRLGSGLGAPALFTAETALFGPLWGRLKEKPHYLRKTALFWALGAGGRLEMPLHRVGYFCAWTLVELSPVASIDTRSIWGPTCHV